MANRHPAMRRKNMERYGGPRGSRRVIERAAADVMQGREDTDCRGKDPSSPQCPSPDTRKRNP